MSSVECGVWSGECRGWSVECRGVWSVECGECEVWNLAWKTVK